MARSYVLNYVHCVFSTKQRTQLIKGPESLWAYIRGIARNCKFDLLAIGGTENHVHLLLALPGGRNLSDVMRDIKANSSRHLRELGIRFAWQDGYAAISVSPSQIPASTCSQLLASLLEMIRVAKFAWESQRGMMGARPPSR
jgi:putative transposase